jgi:hypothetical protein
MFYFSKLYEKAGFNWHRFWDSFANTFSQVYCLIGVLVSLLFNAFLWVLAAWIKRQADSLLVLHSSVDFGPDWIGDSRNIFFLPILALFFNLVNFITLVHLEKSKHFRFSSYLLLSISTLVNIFILVTLLVIYSINFR